MANEKHLAILKKGVAAWNEWRGQHTDVRPDLSEANLSGAGLSDVDLSGAELGGAELGGANLRQAGLGMANLFAADLSGAALFKANLSGANLFKANLSGANLREADLHATNLNWAHLSGTDFSEATLGWTVFADVNLSKAKGLETVLHNGPSTIGVDTIYRSQGKIPEVFLRGAGLPDEFIAYIGSFVGRPIEFYSCFISYSTQDQEFARATLQRPAGQ